MENVLRLYQENVDVLEAPSISWDYSRHKTMGPIGSDMSYWFIKKPKTALRKDFYLQPFEKYLQFVIVGCLILGTGFVVLEALINKKKFENAKLFLVFEIFCNQSNEDAENVSLRIAFLMFNIIGLVLVNSFGAVITSYLFADNPEIPFHNLEEFMQNGQYKLLFYNNSVVHTYLEVFYSTILTAEFGYVFQKLQIFYTGF